MQDTERPGSGVECRTHGCRLSTRHLIGPPLLIHDALSCCPFVFLVGAHGVQAVCEGGRGGVFSLLCSPCGVSHESCRVCVCVYVCVCVRACVCACMCVCRAQALVFETCDIMFVCVAWLCHHFYLQLFTCHYSMSKPLLIYTLRDTHLNTSTRPQAFTWTHGIT